MSNQEIVDACQISNARVFIESQELNDAVEDDPNSLKAAMLNAFFKEELINKIG